VRTLLHRAADHAAAYLEDVDARAVRAEEGPDEQRARHDAALPPRGRPAEQVLDDLVAAAEPGITTMGSPRYFGFVIGGTLPAALAADWMVSTWDQNAGLAQIAPAVAAIEERAGSWLVDVLGLPAGTSFAFVTGCQMAHVTGLAAARHRVLADAGWDVERRGLVGAPPLRVLASEERHVTVDRALRFLGLGTDCLEPLPVDGRGAVRADAVRTALAGASGPTIVCAQAGNVNTGAVDPLAAICDAAADAGAWVHVDGAFGLWAAASARHRHVLDGVERAHSWATDGHKWLNVPYDSGLAFVADPAAHRAAMSVTASYLVQSVEDGARDALDWTPEFSRRARGVPVHAALRSLGRDGVAELVDRLCGCAERFATVFAAEPRVEVLASGLNQVLIRVDDDDDLTDAVMRGLQDDGTTWMSGTVWHGRRCIRISVSNFKTTTADVDRAIEALRRLIAHTRVGAQPAAGQV
jgi:glutamate/tyrosine decarboxylase-like PLP-dependent enzyme